MQYASNKAVFPFHLFVLCILFLLIKFRFVAQDFGQKFLIRLIGDVVFETNIGVEEKVVKVQSIK